MAKKSRKTRVKSKAVGPVQGVNTKGPPVNTINKKAGVVAAQAAVQPKNYDYVKSDLVRIGIIAGVLFLILIILTFIPALKS